jgi:hypothetical protein
MSEGEIGAPLTYSFFSAESTPKIHIPLTYSFRIPAESTPKTHIPLTYSFYIPAECVYLHCFSHYVVNKEQADEFRLKTAIFKSSTKTTKQVFFTLLTTFPIVPNEQSLSTVDIALDMNCLFEGF